MSTKCGIDVHIPRPRPNFTAQYTFDWSVSSSEDRLRSSTAGRLFSWLPSRQLNRSSIKLTWKRTRVFCVTSKPHRNLFRNVANQLLTGLRKRPCHFSIPETRTTTRHVIQTQQRCADALSCHNLRGHGANRLAGLVV